MLEFFWDVASPYTYLASTQVESICQRAGAELRLRPFLLGGLFRAVGNDTPARNQAKRRYMNEDLRRWRSHYGVPMVLPTEQDVFPLNSLLPMRVAVAAEQRGAGFAFFREAFKSHWQEGRNVSEPEVLAPLVEALGLNPQELLEAAQSQPIKDALRANTEEAVERGAFGAPTMFVGEAMFFGNDRLMFVEQALQNS